MGDDEHRTAIGCKIIFQPEERLDIEVIGRLVEDEELLLFQKETAQLQARLFAARHCGDDLIVHRLEPHPVEDGSDAHIHMITVPGIDAFLQTLDLGGESNALLLSRSRKGTLHPFETIDEAAILLKHFAHDGVNGAPRLQPAILRQIADL